MAGCGPAERRSADKAGAEGDLARDPYYTDHARTQGNQAAVCVHAVPVQRDRCRARPSTRHKNCAGNRTATGQRDRCCCTFRLARRGEQQSDGERRRPARVVGNHGCEPARDGRAEVVDVAGRLSVAEVLGVGRGDQRGAAQAADRAMVGVAATGLLSVAAEQALTANTTSRTATR